MDLRGGAFITTRLGNNCPMNSHVRTHTHSDTHTDTDKRESTRTERVHQERVYVYMIHQKLYVEKEKHNLPKSWCGPFFIVRSFPRRFLCIMKNEIIAFQIILISLAMIRYDNIIEALEREESGS